MNYLLDTCVVSELLKKEPDKNVQNWISEMDETSLYLSVLTFGEIHKGIEKLPESRKKDQLHKWVNSDLRERFNNRILNFDLTMATKWGELQGKAELAGKAMSLIDGLIAATGIVNDLIVVTRNTKDMEQSGVSLFNPWL
ncbi:MAG: type II toxin-antitoxin system VapC family toxin [Calditrichaeota bacterium]|nr:MAG: type II toxin-antitoxin system VapC family toxin [Calditrichota bacterium]